MCPQTAKYLSSYWCKCVLLLYMCPLLLGMCPPTAICVRILLYIYRPHIAICRDPVCHLVCQGGCAKDSQRVAEEGG
jgi:hypothetical protein